MNIYDFDGTIYDGDSSFELYFYALTKHPSVLRWVPIQLGGFISYKTGKITKTKFKERFYSFYRSIPDMDAFLEDFWNAKTCKIKAFYLTQKRDDDIIISASPEFQLRVICDRLGVKNLIASEVDKKTGECIGENCRGEEKIIRLREVFPDATIDEFYSDSSADLPLARLAKTPFLVKGNTITKWDIQDV